MQSTVEAKVARVVVAEDPANSMAIGSQIYFHDVGKLHVEPCNVKSVANWEIFNGALLALGFGTRERIAIEGSAAIVAPGVALCARHVIEPRMAALGAGALNAVGFGICGDGVQLWNVRTLTIVDGTDIAILGLQLATAFSDGVNRPGIRGGSNS
jgi:hypothetical protein